MIREEKKRKHRISVKWYVKSCKHVRVWSFKLTDLEDTGGNLIARCTK